MELLHIPSKHIFVVITSPLQCQGRATFFHIHSNRSPSSFRMRHHTQERLHIPSKHIFVVIICGHESSFIELASFTSIRTHLVLHLCAWAGFIGSDLLHIHSNTSCSPSLSTSFHATARRNTVQWMRGAPREQIAKASERVSTCILLFFIFVLHATLLFTQELGRSKAEWELHKIACAIFFLIFAHDFVFQASSLKLARACIIAGVSIHNKNNKSQE